VTTKRARPAAAEPPSELRLPIDSIVIRERHRKYLGNIAGLAESIAALGLLHPVVVTPTRHLIAGERRILAASLLGWKDIPVRIVDLVARPPDGAADVNGETVTIRNDGLATVDITRWTLVDASGKNLFSFPSLALTPGGIAVIHSGRGVPSGPDLYWGKTKGIWNDAGDTATLRDAAGAIVSTYKYP